MIRIGIIGARGYTAGEALRWLIGHPEFEITCLMARVSDPEPVADYFPSLRNLLDVPISPLDLKVASAKCDAVLLCLPHTTAQEHAAALLESGLKVIDLSADFRFDSIPTFESTYGVSHLAPELNEKFPYALPELFGDEIAGAEALACPGCYPTATLLGLAPLLGRAEDFDLDRIVVNALSGVSGAGRKVEEAYLFTKCNENVSAYKVGEHRHRPEIEEKLSRLAGRDIRLTFTPHLIPVTRGILTTATVPMRRPATSESIGALYQKFYADHPFIRVLPAGRNPAIDAVAFTNFCDIGLTADSHSEALIIGSAIDNLGKGAAGQAVQAMNILFGFPETLGLLPGSLRQSAV